MSVDADLEIQRLHLALKKRTNSLKTENLFLKTALFFD